MLSTQEHIEKARHNEDFTGAFDVGNTPFLDWVVTGYFYAALHYVGAYLKKVRAQQPFTHEFTDTLLLNDANLDPIYNDYSDLKNDSQDARYGSRKFGPEYVTSISKIKLESIKGSLKPFLD